MTNGEINRALEANLKKQLRLNEKLIKRGFGNIRSSELRRDYADDVDVAKFIVLVNEASVLRNEAERRYGPGFMGKLPIARRRKARNPKPRYQIAKAGRPRGIRNNPTDRSMRKAVRLYSDFTGHNPTFTDEWDVDVPNTALQVGHVTGILYKTKMDGKMQEFMHEFTGASRPILAASADGRQLLLLGGDYKFTERGIVDGSYSIT